MYACYDFREFLNYFMILGSNGILYHSSRMVER